MKKIIYIARVADDNSDAYSVTFDPAEARRIAEMDKAHLTSRELKTNTVSIEAYTVDVPDDDTRTAQQVFDDWSEGLVWMPDPEAYEEV